MSFYSDVLLKFPHANSNTVSVFKQSPSDSDLHNLSLATVSSRGNHLKSLKVLGADVGTGGATATAPSREVAWQS